MSDALEEKNPGFQPPLPEVVIRRLEEMNRRERRSTQIWFGVATVCFLISLALWMFE